MDDEYDFMAPDGSELHGTLEHLTGTVDVHFTSEGRDYDFSNSGTAVDWDGSETATIDGATIFVDKSGVHWLQHHLIPADAEPVSDGLIASIRHEMRAGRAMEAAKVLEALIEPVALRSDGGKHYAAGLTAILTTTYRLRKSQVKRELARALEARTDA